MQPIIGIDLGTTYSTVATIDSYGRPVVLKNSDSQSLTPSVVYIDPDTGNYICGAEAKEMLQTGEENCAMFFKRFMGDPNYFFTSGSRQYSAADLSAMLLTKLKADAERALGQRVSDVVITVPAYFNDLQRQQTMEAGKKAGLNVLRIINEPTAAAISFGMAMNTSQRLLVYDLGGGTFDVTILDITPGEIKVLATGGDHQLGGKDWDDMLVQHVSEQFRIETGHDIAESLEAYNDLAYDCENIKKQLSTKESASISVRYNGARGKYTVSRAEFEQMTDGLLRTTKDITEIVMSQANLKWHDIDGVLLVGGSTHMPMVRNWVKQMSGKEPLHGVNVHEAVALGAAIQAAIEVERRSFRLGGSTERPKYGLATKLNIIDVMSHSLGAIAQSADGDRFVNSIIIPKNRPIPVDEHKNFVHTLGQRADNQLTLYLTQGESTDINECLIAGKYIIDGFENLRKGETVVDIRYAYDANGMIDVGATQTENGRQLNVTKVPLEEDMSWVNGPIGRKLPVEVVIAVDLSGSMSGEPEEKTRQATKKFIDDLDLGPSTMAIVAFADKADTLAEPSTDKRYLSKKANLLSIDGKVGYGNLNNPIEYAYNSVFKSGGKFKRILIILTDGEWMCKNNAIKWSDRYREEGLDIIAIGFGGADRKFLERISTSSESALLTDLNSLVDNFSSIAREISSSGTASGIRWK